MILVSKDVYAVCGLDLNDGYPMHYAYFTNEGQAIKERDRLNQFFPPRDCHVASIVVWHESGSDRYWLLSSKTRVHIDLPTRQSVTDKLSDKDLVVLGVKR